MAENNITIAINDHVEKLVAINHLEGNVINNGTIYLIATYQVFKEINKSEPTFEEFKTSADTYIQKLRKVHGLFDILGSTKKLDLNEFYIYPRMKLASDSGLGIEISPENLPDFTSYEETYIYGPAGSGKSTFLKYLISNIIDFKIKAIPIYISLASFQAKWRTNFGHTLYDQILQEFKQYGLQKSFVDFMLKNSETILLLDGFDEAYKNEDEKLLLIENIASYKKLFDTDITRVIITSRTKDYDFTNSKRRNIELLPFNKEQIDLFLEKRLKGKEYILTFLDKLSIFYDSTFENRNSSDTPQKDWNEDRVLILAKTRLLESDVHRVVLEKKTYPKILSSPLLLSLLVFQFNNTSSLSNSKVKLYDNIVDYIITKSKLERNKNDFFKDLDFNDLKKLYAYIGYYTLKEDEILFSQKRLFGLVRQFLKENPFDESVQPENIFKSINTDFGLLNEVSDNQFKFIHLTIQEYLASLFLKNQDFSTVFENGLLFKEEWSNVMIFLGEIFGENADFRNKYFDITSRLSFLSSNIRKVIEKTLLQSKFEDGVICYGVVFYYLCILLYYKKGERAIYTCQRLSHEILHRVYGYFKDDANIALVRFSQELKYVAKKINHQNLLIDSYILQLYDKYILGIDLIVNIEEILKELNEINYTDLDEDLSFLKVEIIKKHEKNIAIFISKLLKKRNLDLNSEFSIEDLNIITKLVDLIECYLVSSKNFGKENLDYNDLINKYKLVEENIVIDILPDYLTSMDYFALSSEYEKSNPGLAIEYISKSIIKNPTNAFYYFNRGELLSQNGQHKNALNDFISAENVNPDYNSDLKFQVSFGVLYKRLNEYDKAIQKFNKIIDLDPPDQVSPRWFKIEILLKTNQYIQAIEELKVLISFLPNEGHFYYCISYCYLKLEQYEKSLSNIEKAIKLNFYLTESYFIESYCKIKLNKINDVSLFLSKYLSKNPNDKILYPLLLKCNLVEGNTTKYDTILKMAYKLNVIDHKNKNIMPIPISPGDIEMKRFGKTYHKEDFIFPQYFLLN